MKVGDLVELSAYGKKLKMFGYLHCRVGLVFEAARGSDNYVVQWHEIGSVQHRRKDLKKVS